MTDVRLKPLCFVLMPFHTKPDGKGGTIDFDQVFEQILEPAVKRAGMRCVRADQEIFGGVIHKPMFERLMLCEFAIADLTTANANVFYELGVRHAVRPWSTILVAAQGVSLPFDVGLLRTLPYQLDERGVPATAKADIATVAKYLKAAQAAQPDNKDSPVFQLLDWYRAPDLGADWPATFREELDYSARWKEKIATARRDNDAPAALRAIVDDLGDLGAVEVGLVLDLLISFRDIGDNRGMVELVEQHMGQTVKRMDVVREQYAFALNRIDRGAEAVEVLTTLIADRGPSSERYGLLARVHKDRWEAAVAADREAEAAGFLRKAIDTYVLGFESDWRDPYPGLNAVELMTIADPPDPRRFAMQPVVEFAVRRRLALAPDYWDLAMELELAVLARERDRALLALEQVLTADAVAWQLRSTAQSIARIRAAHLRADIVDEWTHDVVGGLAVAAAR
jgi:hypothetical protein